MRKTIILMAALLVLSSFVFSEVKIGVVNAQEILAKTKKGMDIQKKLEAIQKEKQGKLKAMQDEISKLEKELMSPALNQETREKKGLELQNKRKDIKRYYEDAENEFRRESQKELQKLEEDLMPLIDNIGKSKGFTIVFDITRPGIVYYDKAIDITADVIKAADAKY